MLCKKRGKLKITVRQLFTARPVWPVIVVEDSTDRVLALAEINEKGFRKTLRTGKCHYWDSVNEKVYLKGEHSNEVETFREIRLDNCGARRHKPSLLFRVDVEPGKCLFGMNTCFFYHFSDKRFQVDEGRVIDQDACRENWGRMQILLDEDEDREHQKRFVKKK